MPKLEIMDLNGFFWFFPDFFPNIKIDMALTYGMLSEKILKF